jgi:hypothetical protein
MSRTDRESAGPDSDLDDLIEAYFEDVKVLAASTARLLRERKPVPKEPVDGYDGRLHQWLTEMLNYGPPDGPDQAWPIVLALVNRARDEQTLRFIGASWLEDLVNNAGAQFAHRIRDRAAADSRFRRALCDVWYHADAPTSLRALVDAARAEFWNPQPDDIAAR